MKTSGKIPSASLNEPFASSSRSVSRIRIHARVLYLREGAALPGAIARNPRLC